MVKNSQKRAYVIYERPLIRLKIRFKDLPLPFKVIFCFGKNPTYLQSKISLINKRLTKYQLCILSIWWQHWKHLLLCGPQVHRCRWDKIISKYFPPFFRTIALNFTSVSYKTFSYNSICTYLNSIVVTYYLTGPIKI